MSVNYTKITTTSQEIMQGLISNGIELKPEDKQLIIDKVYDAIAYAYSYKSNGCDCGQPSCAICHG